MTAKSPITNASIADLARAGRLNAEAAGELLRWADERLKALAQIIVELERKMQIMLAADLAMLYLLLQAEKIAAPDSDALGKLLLMEGWLWPSMLTLAWAAALAALFCLGRGLLTASHVGISGTIPGEWNIGHLDKGLDGGGKQGEIRAYLFAQYESRIETCGKAHRRKLYFYNWGLVCNAVLLVFSALIALMRIWG